jgi:phage shock protein A
MINKIKEKLKNHEDELKQIDSQIQQHDMATKQLIANGNVLVGKIEALKNLIDEYKEDEKQ